MIEKEQTAIGIIKKYALSEISHVAFSGGKDSIITYDLVKKSGVPHQAYFAMTTVDPPELLKFIRLFYPEVKWLKPKLSMYQLIIKRGLPIRSRPGKGGRFCCFELKEYAGNGQLVITGIRHEESKQREKRQIFEYSTNKKYKNKRFLNPIIYWTEKEVWDYIHTYNLPYPELYDCGMKRIGCIGCPMVYYKTRQKELNKYPRFKAMYIKAIRKRMEKGFFKEFKNEYDVYEWWVGNKSMKEYLAQKRIEFEYSDKV